MAWPNQLILQFYCNAEKLLCIQRTDVYFKIFLLERDYEFEREHWEGEIHRKNGGGTWKKGNDINYTIISKIRNYEKCCSWKFIRKQHDQNTQCKTS